MKYIPITLIYLRLFIGFALLLLSFSFIENFGAISVTLITIGLVSDIFDGMIARRLNISTVKLRRLDSTIDQIFWCLIGISAFIKFPDFFHHNYPEILLLFGVEAVTYIISFIKFRKEVATHAIFSKIWTLILFATLIELFIAGNSTVLFQICFYVGLITRLEIIAILFILKEWTNDVPSIFHTVKLRQGLEIKRNKLFNG